MKMLLTSGGIQNPSIKKALIELLEKPIEECAALCITTSSYAYPKGHEMALSFLNGTAETPMCELGWKSIGVLELSILNSIDQEIWLNQLKKADVLLVNGGDPLFLNYWMKQSGVADVLPSLDLVYVGLSAGSMIMTPQIGKPFVRWHQPDMNDDTLGLVDFAIYPHLDHEKLPSNTMENAIQWAAGLRCPAYAIDDQTAIQVIGDQVSVISEGKWHFFEK